MSSLISTPMRPEPGQVVEVRGSVWAVANVQAQGLPRSPADDATAQLVSAAPERRVDVRLLQRHICLPGVRVVACRWLSRVGAAMGPGVAGTTACSFALTESTLRDAFQNCPASLANHCK